ncbi:MAG: M55 family metallopeptidase [Anaerolineae bacterium]|nr:M55 family metallopeptidase [Anaerolineae bacterium]
MHVFISADMEGVSGVVLEHHVSSEHREYERFRRLMTAEVNAAIEGALDGGADQVTVNDGHGGMANILIEELNPAAVLISGAPKPLGMMEGIGAHVDAVFLIGYHAASGTGAAVMEHTWTGRVFELRLNGRPVGEMELNAALAGAYGVPVVLVTGDRAVTEAAQALPGRVETVAVKEGIGRSAARCLQPRVAHEHIRQAAARALQQHGGVPFVVPPPITLSVTFIRTSCAEMAELIPGSRRVDGRTVEWSGDDMVTVYKVFRAMAALAAQ